MHVQTNHTPWVAQRTPSLMPALVLALVVHCLLFVALSFEIRKQFQTQVPMVVEAQLWSEVPQFDSAPPALPTELASSVSPSLDVPETPTTSDVKVASPSSASSPSTPITQPIKAVDIAAGKPPIEKKKTEETTKSQGLQQEKHTNNNEEKKKSALRGQARKDTQQNAQELKDTRRENIERMRALAQGMGTMHGAAAQRTGTSANYATRIRTLLKNNTIYTGSTAGNPKVEIEIRTAPDGRILSRKVVKASSVPAWDDAVLQAIDRTQTLPSDTNGRIPSIILVVHSPIDF